MMRTLLLLALLLVVGVEAQPGRVASDYIRIATQPDFQYRTDQDVLIPVQARIVRGGVPQSASIHLEVRTTDGTAFPVPGGQADLRDGIPAYPRILHLNLGRLDPGLYRVVLHVWGDGLERDWPVEFDVVYPPEPYSAILVEARGNEGRFLFRAHRDVNFTLTMYRDGSNGPTILTRITTNATTLRVPYIPGESIKITVQDPHGWTNTENTYHDDSGYASYPPYIWNPDYRQITNYQRHSWQETLTAGVVLAGLLVLLVLVRRRQA